MDTHTVERAHVDVESGFRLRLSQLIIFDERGWVLPITFALRCIAVYVVDKFLQLVQAHQSIQLLMQPGDYGLKYVRNRTHMAAREKSDRFGIAVFQQQIKILQRYLIVFFAIDDQERRARFLEPALVEQRQDRHHLTELLEGFLAE